MKKIFALSLLVVMFAASCASATVTVGRHSMLNFTESELVKLMQESTQREFFVGLDVTDIAIKFYDSLVLLQMALNKGEVEVLSLPQCVAEYMLDANKNYVIKGVDWWFVSSACTLNFAFLEDNKTLRDRFNNALADMKRLGTLGMLEHRYITDPEPETLKPVEFPKFPGEPTITVAVTGDLPPIDYVAPDGTPAGYNTALLAELANKLHVNIKTVIVETGARAAAIQSGRVDVVFWFQSNIDETMPAIDVPQGLILSQPYYKWNEQYFIGLKAK